MRFGLLGYGLRRGVPLWVWAGALAIGLGLGPEAEGGAAQVLGLGGLVDGDGLHRARVISLVAGIGFVVCVWRAACLGRDLAGRDRAWMGLRTGGVLGRGGAASAAGTALIGVLLSAALFVIPLSIAGELRAESHPAQQQLARLHTDQDVLYLAGNDPTDADYDRFDLPSVELELRSAQITGTGATQLTIFARPLAGKGRVALIQPHYSGPNRFNHIQSSRRAGDLPRLPPITIGTARLVTVPLLPHTTKIRLDQIGTDPAPPIAFFPSEAWLTRPVPSSRGASFALALCALALIAAASALAAGLATRLSPSLAALASACALIVSTSAGFNDALGAAAWPAALATVQAGNIPSLPGPATWLAAALCIAAGWLMLTRAIANQQGAL